MKKQLGGTLVGFLVGVNLGLLCAIVTVLSMQRSVLQVEGHVTPAKSEAIGQIRQRESSAAVIRATQLGSTGRSGADPVSTTNMSASPKDVPDREMYRAGVGADIQGGLAGQVYSLVVSVSDLESAETLRGELSLLGVRDANIARMVETDRYEVTSGGYASSTEVASLIDRCAANGIAASLRVSPKSP